MKRATLGALNVAVWLSTVMAFAQSQAGPTTSVFDPTKSGVKVIFAPQKAEAPPQAVGAGQRAHVDPQGKLKDPDPEESQKLSEQMKSLFSRPVENVVLINGLGGSVGAVLGEEFMQAATATIGTDGKLQLKCGPGAQVLKDQKLKGSGATSAAKGGADVR